MTLKASVQFQHAYQTGARWHTPVFTLFYLPKREALLGLTVSKKVGNAVVRNRVRRQLKAIYAQQLPLLKCGTIVMVAKQAAAEVTFGELEQSFLAAIRRLKLLQPNLAESGA